MSLNRRRFLRQAGSACAGIASLVPALRTSATDSPNRRILVGVMGTNGRGLDHIAALLAQPNCEIAYVCDVDTRALAKGVAAVTAKQGKAPQGVKDFRKILDDAQVDALTIAAPNHWHGPATILACAAGKHVYVEKPCSHNPREGELMVEAARKHQRVVQMGSQRRSWPWVIEIMERLRGGEFGKVCFARTWYNNSRASIGRGKAVPVPDWLDYSLWQGPAPERPYVDNLVHYNWHWRWHWGNGELGNNGVHSLDMARWALKVDYPRRVTCNGGRYHFTDDQETPDTCVTTFDFGEKGATWDGHSCDPHGMEGTGFGITFHCEKATVVISGTNFKVFDPANKQVSEGRGPGGDAIHFANFLDAIRGEKKATAEIAEGVKSTLLCHLGNIALRTGQTLEVDPATGRIQGSPAASAYWSREYREGWQPRVG